MNTMCPGGLVNGYVLSWDLVPIFLRANFKGSKRFKRLLRRLRHSKSENPMNLQVIKAGDSRIKFFGYFIDVMGKTFMSR